MLKFLEKVLDCLEIEKVEFTLKKSKPHQSKTIITVKRKKVKSKNKK